MEVSLVDDSLVNEISLPVLLSEMMVLVEKAMSDIVVRMALVMVLLSNVELIDRLTETELSTLELAEEGSAGVEVSFSTVEVLSIVEVLCALIKEVVEI